MGAGNRYNAASRFPPSIPTHHQRKKSDDNLDRFIPNRSAIDFDYAHFMLTGGKVVKESPSPCSPFNDAYRKRLAEVFNMNRIRILAFKNKPPSSVDCFQEPLSTASEPQPAKARRFIPQSAEKVLDAPEILDDYYLNLLDWGSNNILAIGLGNSVYLWDASDGSTTELLAVDGDLGPVTSVRWAPDGRHIAVGLDNSNVQLWDSVAIRLLRTLREGHRLRVGSLDWNSHILTTGGMDSLIVNNDVRVSSHIVGSFKGHSQEVCGLKWSASGQQLASGGNDNLLYVWNISMASSRAANQWIHRLTDHTAAVKALAWCPFQSSLLASGGGVGDQCIKFWNTNIGACLNTVNAGSQVSSLLWNKHERELLSAHGFEDNQLSLWKYPSMAKITELHGHTSRVLYMVQSPDGYTVASAAADQTLRIWNVFGTPGLKKPTPEPKSMPFAHLAHIR